MRRRIRHLALGAAAVGLSAWAGLSACTGPALLNAYASRDGVAETRGVAYGPHPRQRYDLYEPADSAGPLIVFFHGGAWDSGDPALYPFVGRRLARLGFAVAVPGYRLYPDVTFPAFVEDAAAAVAALRARFPDRPLVLMGHSAGAQIAALAMMDRRFLAAHGLSACETVAAYIGLAGPYDFLPLREDRYKRVFPEETRPLSQPLAFAADRHPPALLLHGAADTTVHAEDSTILAEALQAAGNRAEAVIYPGVDHLSILGAISPLIQGWAPTLGDMRRFLAREAAAGFPGCTPPA
jgi:acetyl esterase/lipase